MTHFTSRISMILLETFRQFSTQSSLNKLIMNQLPSSVSIIKCWVSFHNHNTRNLSYHAFMDTLEFKLLQAQRSLLLFLVRIADVQAEDLLCVVSILKEMPLISLRQSISWPFMDQSRTSTSCHTFRFVVQFLFSGTPSQTSSGHPPSSLTQALTSHFNPHASTCKILLNHTIDNTW